MSFSILSLLANDKATDWAIKIKNEDGLMESKRRYDVSVAVNTDYFKNKIAKIDEKIEEISGNPDMFDNWKENERDLKDQIKALNNEQADCEKLEIKDFIGKVNTVDYDKDVLVITIPEEIIEGLIKIRHIVDAFTITLK